MRLFSKTLASSVFFTSVTPAFSTSAQLGPQGTPSSAGFIGSISIFGAQGALGGPLAVQFGTMISMQANFGVLGAVSTSGGNYGGVFNLLGSNTNEKSTFTAVKTATISTTSASLLIDSAPAYRFIDFQFIPSTAMSSTGFVTVTLLDKGNY